MKDAAMVPCGSRRPTQLTALPGGLWWDSRKNTLSPLSPTRGDTGREETILWIDVHHRQLICACRLELSGMSGADDRLNLWFCTANGARWSNSVESINKRSNIVEGKGCETAVRSQESAPWSERSAGCCWNERAEETEEDAGLRLWSRSTRHNLGHSLQGDYRYRPTDPLDWHLLIAGLKTHL